MNNTYIKPTIKSKGFSFVLASTQQKNYAGNCVYVKYKNGPNKITVKQEDADHVWYVCPDRELVIVNNNEATEAFYPSGDSFDEILDLNLFNDVVCKGLGIEYTMTNFAHDSKAKNNRQILQTKAEDRIQILSDSGGLQLAKGIKSKIHPKELMEFYNNNVDAGMVLDFPVRFSNPKIIKMAAKQQKANTDVLLRYSKGVELINICHGDTPQERDVYRQIVDDDRINRMAIGGMGRYKSTAVANTIYENVLDIRKYKQYHVLGVYRSEVVPILIKLSNCSLDIHITADSTSHIQSALNKAYHHQFDMYHNMKRIPIGIRGSVENTFKYLPCQCPICKIVKYTDILAFGNSRYVLELLSIHNGIEMIRYAASLEQACNSMSHKEYSNLIALQLKNSKEKNETIRALDFINIVEKHGIKQGRSKYRHFLDNKKLDQEQLKDLFGNVEKEESKQDIILDRIKQSRQLLIDTGEM